MKRPEITPLSRVLLGVASLAGVLWSLVMQVDEVSPGPLAAAHAREPELTARKNCIQCHGEGAKTMADACETCHEPIAHEIAGSSGFHGHMAQANPRDCAQGHSEHSGSDFQLVSERSFRLAGFETREAYDHSDLDFLLQGRHARLGCVDCHKNADVVSIPKGKGRFIGLEQGCQNCHEDAHEGRIVRACAECHGQEHPFSLVASFQHETFGSSCGHAASSCSECHPKGSAHDAELLAGPQPPSCARSCQTCHTSPHGEAFTTAVDALADVQPGDGCAQCHDEAQGTFLGHLESTPPAIHAASGFALDPPHADLACAACHLEISGDDAHFGSHVPARTQDDCRACHGDPHEGDFLEGPFSTAGCLDCHARKFFAPSAFSTADHARTDFPLVASHEAVACVRCHETPADGSMRHFEGTSTTCADCHADAHRGAFDQFENPEGCARCHEPTLFSKYVEAGFVHAEWTDFALDGAHARLECKACHASSARPDETGRTFGHAEDRFHGPANRCDTCHADVHEGRFDGPDHPAEVDGRTDCARCHTTETWSQPIAEKFEHERWTGYPMAEFHADVECAKCHIPRAKPDRNGRTFGVAPKRCEDCHADPHVAQFAVQGKTDCARCHQDAGGLAFDHDRDSRFKLDETHKALECKACHVPWPLPGGGEAVRYKPLGTECVDCHDPEFLKRAERGTLRPRKDRTGFSTRGGR